MTGRRVGIRRASPRPSWAVLLAVASPWLPAIAQINDDVSNGIKIGPVVVAPSATCSYSYDSNPFLFDETGEPRPEPQAVSTIQPAVAISLPFGHSSLRLTDTLRWMNYAKTTELNGRGSNVASAALTLNFSTQDSLELTADLTDGRADTLAFDPGGQIVFRGQSYRLDRQGVRLSREIFGQRGYRASVERSDFRFEQVQRPGFFDFTGYDGEAALLIPVSENANVSLGYLGTRFDHFDAGPGSNPDAIFRREVGDTAYLGVEGLLGQRRPYHLRVGWESLKFTLGPPGGTDFRGIVGDGALSLVGGSGFTLVGTVVRTPYRSFLQPNNYYLYEAAGLEIRHPSPSGTAVGGTVLLSLVSYPDPVVTPGRPDEVRRRDTTYSLEGYANLAVRDHVSFRISLRRAVRTSDFPGGNFQGTVLSGGFIFGWL